MQDGLWQVASDMYRKRHFLYTSAMTCIKKFVMAGPESVPASPNKPNRKLAARQLQPPSFQLPAGTTRRRSGRRAGCRGRRRKFLAQRFGYNPLQVDWGFPVGAIASVGSPGLFAFYIDRHDADAIRQKPRSCDRLCDCAMPCGQQSEHLGQACSSIRASWLH